MIGSIAALTALSTSCGKEEGCTDESALNYDSNAEEDDGSCVYESTSGNLVVTENISGNVTWTNDRVYELGGRITVLDGGTLTIQPGTVIKGQAGSGPNATAILVARGGKLIAEGTAQAPIIFTSVADEITPEQVASGDVRSPNLDPNINGLWGGIIVCGKAKISASNNSGDVVEVQVEGIPTSDPNGLYGGNDDADNSGVIKYISIRHGGTNIGAGNEINGLTLGGVGTGTVIEHVEVVANQDDGIEWFGGSVDVDNAVIWNAHDDGLDSDQDWIGTCTNFIIVTPIGGSAFELDGPEGSLNRGTHQFINGVVYAGEDIDHVIDWDANTNAGVKDVYFFGFSEDYPSTGFEPIETFGGDGTGDNSGWQYTLNPAGADVTTIFNGVPASILTEVGLNANTVGPDASAFGWTWAAQSGALASIGL